MIERAYQDLNKYLKPNKVLVIYGARQVGKTTLLQSFLKTLSVRYRLDSGDNIKIQQILGSGDFEYIKEYARGYDLIAIDEAQKIANVGLGLKILVDEIPDIKIIATGSSSFELAGQIGEPLTGRKTTLTLYPISQLELSNIHNDYDLKESLHNYLIFGSYPEIVTSESNEEKRNLLFELTESYLLKDILEIDKVKASKKLLDLLCLLAFQIGNEVSLTELGQKIGLDYKTVARYLDLLEKSFVIYNLRGFSRNLRKEITQKSKYYFFDNGVRNAIISNFNEISLRNDIGALWENFLFMERLKKRSYQSVHANSYFWRTWDKKEIDLIEEREGSIYAYEFKWNHKKTLKPPEEWVKAYPEAAFNLINPENYLEFIK